MFMSSLHAEAKKMRETDILLQAAMYAVLKCQAQHRYCVVAAYTLMGEPLMMVRMRNTTPLLSVITRAKADTSALFRTSSAKFGGFSRFGKPFYGFSSVHHSVNYQFTVIPGGDTFKLNDHIAGSIAISNIKYKKNVQSFDIEGFDYKMGGKLAALVEQMNKTNQPIYDLSTVGLDKEGKTKEDAIAFIHAAYMTLKDAYQNPNMRMVIAMAGRAKMVDDLISMPNVIPFAPELVIDKAIGFAMHKHYKTKLITSIQAAVSLPSYGDQYTGAAITYYLANKGFLSNLYEPIHMQTFVNTFKKAIQYDNSCVVT